MDGKRREKTKRSGVLQALRNALRGSISEQNVVSKEALGIGVIIVALGFLFAGTHTFFGAYPLGLAFVTAGFAVGAVSSVFYISSIGTMLGRGALVSLVLVLFLLPGLLILMDKKVTDSSSPVSGGQMGRDG